MADGAPAVPAVPGGSGNQSGTGTGLPAEAKPGETKAQAVARLKADLGDGEQEYEQSHLVELARRGKKTAQIMSKAEQRAQEGLRKEQEAEARLAKLKSKDWKERRAALKELDPDFDEVAYAKQIAQEVMEAEALTPEQRRIRELEQRLQAEDAAKNKTKKDEEARAIEVETRRHMEDFSNLFLDVMQRAGLPRESATASFYRLSAMYQAADAAGAQLDPDVAAERLKHAMRDEHTALFRKKDGALDLDAFEASFSPEDWKAINRRAVEKYRASRSGRPTVQQAPAPQAAPGNGASRPSRPGNFWKELDQRLK